VAVSCAQDVVVVSVSMNWSFLGWYVGVCLVVFSSG
jgi:hypothetical protein